ncbi:MAG TPA: DUF4197 domain-containing protein [Burkholderiales bacterium]|nr:DUF4197 domain-containing protein [Burkholderiales bacterium]
MLRYSGILAALVVSSASGITLDDISNRDAINGLKQALANGAQSAVVKLGKQDGFMNDSRIRIPLPPSMKRAEAMMHSIGAGKQADDLVLKMNRAAEAAVPQAKPLLIDAAKKMTVQDAKGILTGGPDSATQYFKRTTTEPLVQKFKPVVKKAMAKVKLAEAYNEIAASGAKFGLVKDEDASLEDYVTRKALDGLFIGIADEEKKIRENPAAAASSIVKKVFGALVK